MTPLLLCYYAFALYHTTPSIITNIFGHHAINISPLPRHLHATNTPLSRYLSCHFSIFRFYYYIITTSIIGITGAFLSLPYLLLLIYHTHNTNTAFYIIPLLLLSLSLRHILPYWPPLCSAYYYFCLLLYWLSLILRAVMAITPRRYNSPPPHYRHAIVFILLWHHLSPSHHYFCPHDIIAIDADYHAIIDDSLLLSPLLLLLRHYSFSLLIHSPLLLLTFHYFHYDDIDATR